LITIRLGARTMLAVIALVATAYLFVYIPHFFLIVLVAAVLAIAIDDPVTSMRQRGIPRPLGVLAIYALLIVFLMVALLALAPVVAGDARAGARVAGLHGPNRARGGPILARRGKRLLAN
jgi:predicted PurR-regulated permease PerM